MIIIFQKAYKFNLDTNAVNEVPIPEEETDFSEYVKQLILDVVSDNHGRKFLFPGEESRTMADMGAILDGDRGPAARKLARRLMTEENKAQERIARLKKEIQRGIMIQALITMGEVKYFLIIKAEHFDYIDENSTQLATGLPIKKKIFKSFNAKFDGNDTPLFAMVSDNKAEISTYWWQDFLELEEEYTDEYNTVKSFDVIEKKIFIPMKENFPRDYLYLRNATITYFRSKKEFILDKYVRDVIESYEPIDPDNDMDRVAERIRSLGESGKFNTRFLIVKEKLKKRIITTLRLTPQLDLVIKENIKWDNSVQAIEEDGIKYIMIQSEDGYNYFKNE